MSVGSREQAWGSTRNKDQRVTMLSPDSNKTTSHVTTRNDELAITSKGLNNKQKHLFLWSYKEPNKILLVNLDKLTVSALKEFVEKQLVLIPDSYSLASLIPGTSHPIPLLKSGADLSKAFIICLPTKSVRLHIRGDSDEDEITIKLHPLQTIKELKNEIHQRQGYPVYVQELVYGNTILQNRQLIIDYKIRDNDELSLYLQPEKSFLVYVDTFWNKRYSVEVTSCSTAEDLLHKIFRKTLAKATYREQISKFKPMYQGLMHLEYENNVLDNTKCLNYYGIRSKSNLQVHLLSERRGDQRKVVMIRDDQGQSTVVPCAGYDTWYIVALKLHGSSAIPIDVMQLLLNDRPVDLQCTVSIIKSEKEVINADLFLLPPPSSLLGKLTIHVTTATGNTEKLQCGPKETIKDVKRRLDNTGLHYAPYYDIFYKNVRLPGNTKLLEYNLAASEHCSMELKMNDFPVCIRSGTNTFKLMVHKEATVANLLRKIEDKIGCSPIKFGILHSGEDLYNYDSLMIQETYLHINSQLYVETVQRTQSLYLVNNSTELALTSKSNLSDVVTQQLQESGVDVGAFYEYYKWFLKWRYPSRSKTLHDLRMLGARSPSRHRHVLTNPRIMTNEVVSAHLHNSSHERNRCKPKSSNKQVKIKGSSTSPGPYIDSKSTLPHIGQHHHGEKNSQYSSMEMLSNPKPALKAYSKSTELLSVTPTSGVLSPDSLSRTKKKLSVRFEVPDRQVQKKDKKLVYPWSMARKIPSYSPPQITTTAYSPKGNKTFQRSRSGRGASNLAKQSNVAIKFQLDI